MHRAVHRAAPTAADGAPPRPAITLGAMPSDEDPAKSGRPMRAMLGMEKLDLAALRRAYEAGGTTRQ